MSAHTHSGSDAMWKRNRLTEDRARDLVYVHSNLRLLKNIQAVNYVELECGPMPNLMVALPNIVGALWSTLQSLADAHY